ncbi:hypothetical protein [Candidatus Protochlamydia naegleriophila]|uniref:hypothetical protein n=1 Tax=Candidatus Protochlamydia naegleriophila TaxID=389348 RepID=UPI001300E233|nr:hypothetical protein [Candidatus Protochlamydia naegleriophila]
MIEKHGSVACSISEELGEHEIVIDRINDDLASIRDPFHGWHIEIPTSELLKKVPILDSTVV